MGKDTPHSLQRMALQQLLSPEDWLRVRKGVEQCRYSWPVSWEPANAEAHQTTADHDPDAA